MHIVETIFEVVVVLDREIHFICGSRDTVKVGERWKDDERAADSKPSRATHHIFYTIL